MKKLAYTFFVAFWASIATIFGLTYLVPEPPACAEPELPFFSADDLSKHNDAASCWIAIEGKIYNITNYISLHPTSPEILLPWCGQEATQGMRTKGYGRDHSAAAWAELDNYLVGRLAE
ncbi:MAG: cytochrome b5 domain-containing protein [bacterium]